MNATSPLGKFLAAIAGKLDKSKLPTPSNEAEYYLNEIAQKDSGSGGSVFIVPFTFDHEDGDSIYLTTSVSMDEIISAAASKSVVAVYDFFSSDPEHHHNESFNIYLPLTLITESERETGVTFCSFYPDQLSKITIRYDSKSNYWEYFTVFISSAT